MNFNIYSKIRYNQNLASGGQKMKVLVVGSGGKEHSIVTALAQSERVSQIFCATGNAGIGKIAECVDIKIDDIQGLCNFAKNNNIDLTIVSSKLTLRLGIVDLFKKNNLLIFGPTQAATKIETSKSYAKDLFYNYFIPTAPYSVFDKAVDAVEFVKHAKFPLYVKYDGAYTSQSVFLCENFEQAKNVIENCFTSLYKAVVVEEMIVGKEFSFHIITDGYHAVPLPSCKVYKKAFDGNSGPNTDGMGANAPVNFVDSALEARIAQKIIFPLIDAMANEGIPFVGIMQTTLLIDEKNNPYLVGVNSAIGDPEAQTILPLLEDDLFEIFYSASIGAFSDDYECFNISDSHSVSVVLASVGYPGPCKKGSVIEGLDIVDDDNLFVFHSGTVKNKYAEHLASDGRVLTVTAVASTLSRACDRAYEAVDLIEFKDMRYRKDIADSKTEHLVFY